ncbi:hypothetical protein NKH09_28475 [Mesorhizobium sp. M1339]|uniref:hypothetical protein n=1 Tax=Mesorhizobium sp. M1339 TaxID=2957086 RepID=UPI00333C3876
MITSTVVRQHQRRIIGIIIIGSVGAVGMIHVFVTLIIIIVAADQVSDCLPLLTRLSPCRNRESGGAGHRARSATVSVSAGFVGVRNVIRILGA